MPEVLTTTSPNITTKKDLLKPNLNNSLEQASNEAHQKSTNKFNIDEQRQFFENIYKDEDTQTLLFNEVFDNDEIEKENQGDFSKFIDKFMLFTTCSAVGLNGFSIITESLANLGMKNNISSFFNKLVKPFEKLALFANKAQAGGFGVGIFKEALDRNDATFLIAGLGKIFQILLGNNEDFLLLGGIQAAFDQLQPGCKKIIGTEKFRNFAHSFKEYFNAIKTVLKEVKEDPFGYMKLTPKSGKVEQVLIPGSILMLTGTFGYMLAGKNKILKTLASSIRHVIGGVLGGDVILSRIQDNGNLNISGYFYGSGSLGDTLSFGLNDKWKGVGHKLANMSNFIGELFMYKGLKNNAPQTT